uniref:Structural protein n=1 Tax=Pseudomonas phage PA_L9 TaxID=3232177 RepID=A0AAU8L0T1_9CAUD
MSKKAYELMKKRADLSIGQITSAGGVLLPQQSNRFIDFILEQPTVIRQARVIRMGAPEVNINRMGFDSRVLRAARQDGSANDDGSNDRYVRKADRAAPNFGKIPLTSKEVIAEVRIPYEVLEDNIEGASFEEHLMRSLAERVAVDLEELALWGDTTLGATDPYLALFDGWMKLANVHVLDNASAGITPDVFALAQKTLPQKYARLLPQLKAFVSVYNQINYRQAVARRQTGYGDSALQNAIDVRAYGLPIEPAPMIGIKENGESGLVTVPQNLILGIRRDITLETAKDIRSREIIIVVTARVGTQIDDRDAVVRLKNLGGLSPIAATHVIVDNAADFPGGTP